MTQTQCPCRNREPPLSFLWMSLLQLRLAQLVSLNYEIQLVGFPLASRTYKGCHCSRLGGAACRLVVY